MPWRVLAIAALLVGSVAGCSLTRPASGSDSSLALYEKPIILFVSPDEADLERLKAELGDDFPTVADDAMWYRSEAIEFAEQQGFTYAHADADEAFFRIDGIPRVFSWAREDRPWFNVLYDGSHEPRILYDIDLPEAMDSLMNEE